MTFPASPARSRARRNDLPVMAESNLRVLLRVLYRQHGAWIGVARVLRIRRTTIEGFYHDDKPATLALARAIATATGLDLDVALAGQFVIMDKGVKAIGGAR
jgi:hypothetical protein